MRIKHGVDRNHSRIVGALRRVGARVQDLAGVGNGVPDLLVGYARKLVLLEIKNPEQPMRGRRLNDAESAWHLAWSGYPVYVVETEAEALRAAGVPFDSDSGKAAGQDAH